MARLRVETLEGRHMPSAALSAVPGMGFTPPIGSNKGSFVAGIASDGLGATWPYGVAAPAAQVETSEASNVPTQGIIAILIGLNAPAQPTAGNEGTRAYHLLPFIEQDN